jgi:hypothetical protein
MLAVLCGAGKRIKERALASRCFDNPMEVRACSERDLELLRIRWPTADDIAGAHYAEQQAGTATFLVGWEDDEPLGWALIQWRGYRPAGVIDVCSYRWRDDQGSWHDKTEFSELLVKRL